MKKNLRQVFGNFMSSREVFSMYVAAVVFSAVVSVLILVECVDYLCLSLICVAVFLFLAIKQRRKISRYRKLLVRKLEKAHETGVDLRTELQLARSELRDHSLGLLTVSSTSTFWKSMDKAKEFLVYLGVNRKILPQLDENRAYEKMVFLGELEKVISLVSNETEMLNEVKLVVLDETSDFEFNDWL